MENIPEEYLQYLKLFNEELEISLLEYGLWDHEITLKPGIYPYLMKVYPINETFWKVLDD